MTGALLFLLAGCHAQPGSKGATGPRKTADRPNVVVIITDDQGIGDFGIAGNAVLQTPHLDALARRSVSVSDFYVSPVCSPTRASLMTGRYHMRTQCIDTYQGRSRMSPEEVTLAEAMRGAGYATGIFGKWHLGDNHPMRPTDQGFDEALIHRGGGIGQSSDTRDKPGQYTNPVLYHNNHEVNPTGYCTDIYFDAAIGFINKQAESGQPFFTYIATNAPHGPYHDVPEGLLAEYAARDLSAIMAPNDHGKPEAIDRLARIGAMITNIDQNVGKLVGSLEASGLIDNTIILYLNDNGPNTRRYVGDLHGHTFRGMKTEVYEGGIRSPLWVRWDGVLEPARQAELIAAHIDLMPTLLDACGVAAPEGVVWDGRSILPVLNGERETLPERAIVVQAHRGTAPNRYNNFMIRRGDWKLLNATRPWGNQDEKDPTFELYNLSQDPGESNNLASDRPEKLAELRAAYDAWFDDMTADFARRRFPQLIVIDPTRENPAMLTRQDWDGSAWPLRVDKPGRYDIRLELGPGRSVPGEGWTARLVAGEQAFERPIGAGQSTALFEAVSLPAGVMSMRGVFVKQGQRDRAAHHLRVIGR
ncbi:MAG: arylsulfatase [Planctomycetota bacterium]